MLKRVRLGAVVAALLVASTATLGGTVSGASAATHWSPETVRAEAARAALQRGATVTTSAKQVVEGDRLTLTVTIKAARQAAKVTLQKWQPSLYGWDDPKWNPVKTVAVRGKAEVKFAAVATDENMERYRAVVTYKEARPFTSRPVNVTVWRWIPLKEYAPYYQSEPYGAIFGTTTINGVAYSGWGAATYSHTGAWESRFTPGRHCKTFRGVLGVGDISADGSSGAINFTADDTIIYQSPSLTPGMDLPVNISLAKPYRFGIQLFDTTPDGTTGRDAVESWPVIGEPAFLCTGV
jgi:hypothetical protein